MAGLRRGEVRLPAGWPIGKQHDVEMGSQHGEDNEMQQKVKQDIALVCSLKASAGERDLEKGSSVHADVLKRGSLGENIFIGSTLVNMYAKCGALGKAQQVFDELPVRNEVSWNALITGYAQHGHGHEVLSCFEQMKHEGLSPNAVTFLCILKACGGLRAVEKGRAAHTEMVREGLLRKDVVLGTALLDMYVKCGALSKAQDVFDELTVQTAISWTALITGYCQYGYGKKALNCFEHMKCEGLSPDAVTFACILKACGSIGAIEKGIEIHDEILRKGMLKEDDVLCTALADMYAKCGELAKAQRVLEEHPIQDIVSWNALIAGYCQHGHCVKALECFEKMKHKGFTPDEATFTSILKVCGSTGAIEKGQMYFETMSTRYGIIPSIEHETSMADLFGRAGHFDKAMKVFTKMQSLDHFPSWVALLGACQKWGNVKIGTFAFRHATQLDEELVSCYVIG